MLAVVALLSMLAGVPSAAAMEVGATGAIVLAADEPHLPGAVPRVGPVRRGPSGEIELATPPAEPSTQGSAPESPRPRQPKKPRITVSDAMSRLLATMAPGTWAAIPDSKMVGVAWRCVSAPCPHDGPLARAIEGSQGVAAVMNDWSGGVIDGATDSLLVWGGGHQGYYGNEVYAFNLSRLRWSMLSRPSPIEAWDRQSAVLPDGNPAVSHTYDALAYVAEIEEILQVGSAAPGDNGYALPNSWLFKPATGRWRPAAALPIGYGGNAVTDPISRHVFAIGVSTPLHEYDPSKDRWIRRGGSTSLLPDVHMVAAIDPDDRLFVSTGAGFIRGLSLETGQVLTESARGDQSVQKGNAPGFVWYPDADRFVGWNGGASLYLLDASTWTWVGHAAAPANTVTPTRPAPNGTFGRFQYDATHGCFIVVNGVDQDVYVYRPDF